MTDKEKLVEVVEKAFLNVAEHDIRLCDNCHIGLVDAIIAAGFGDVSAYKDLLENAEKYAWGLKDELREKDKRIAELEEQINNYILRSVNNQKILNGEGKDGG